MTSVTTGKMEFSSRRGVFIKAATAAAELPVPPAEFLRHIEDYDLIYRTLCGILFNFVPQSGHPGGSISSGRVVESLLFNSMNYTMGDPDRHDADLISYAAGHKAMGLYGMWALRNEIQKQHNESVLPRDERHQLRLEDLLGFRRNPTQHTPLFKKFKAKPLDGHPAPLVPFIKLSTGASGVGIGSSFGLAFGARDYFADQAPFVHMIEGEGGLTPGRAQEAMATAATAQVNNIIMHLDWNQASIDSDKVCREGEEPGDYVQWNPLELAWLHDWNVIYVEDGFDYRQILAAQQVAISKLNDQPTCIVYRTVKGWKYGIEGRKSHGAGHKFCSPEFYNYLQPFEERFKVSFPRFEGDKSDDAVEALFYEQLLLIRQVFADNPELVSYLGDRLDQAAARLEALNRQPREDAPRVANIYKQDPLQQPTELITAVGGSTTLRAALGDTLGYLNRQSGGSILVAAADLYGSTSISNANAGYAGGFWNAVSNSSSRQLSIGGICEDSMGALMSGISAFGTGVGVASSYGAFIAPLEHIAARLHGIGQQARKDYNDSEFNPFFLVCAHAGLKTGEDGPTHADPQPLQLLQENFPRGIAITLMPWDPNEIWPLVVAALNQRPAIIAPFVTRPNETILDREALGLPPATAAIKGVYPFRTADPGAAAYHGTLVLQGSGITNVFLTDVLPRIDQAGLNLNIFYVSSVELFDTLPATEQADIFPESLAMEAMGITGFTLPTLYRWVRSDRGRAASLYPYRDHRYLGSGQAHKVLEEANLHGEGQWQAIKAYAESFVR